MVDFVSNGNLIWLSATANQNNSAQIATTPAVWQPASQHCTSCW